MVGLLCRSLDPLGIARDLLFRGVEASLEKWEGLRGCVGEVDGLCFWTAREPRGERADSG